MSSQLRHHLASFEADSAGFQLMSTLARFSAALSLSPRKISVMEYFSLAGWGRRTRAAFGLVVVSLNAPDSCK